VVSRMKTLPGTGGVPVPESSRIPLSLYIHWPWCVRKCPYCDFNSRPVMGALPTETYVSLLLRDLESQLEYLRPGRRLETIYIGGGTPSLMAGKEIGTLLQGVRNLIEVSPECEISMEANPGTVESDSLIRYREAGVNRLSLGVQSFNDRELRILGRIHSADDARAAIRQAAAALDNFNIDIMFGLPGETRESLAEDLREAIGSGSTHLSFYQLTIEEGTAFARRVPEGIPDPDTLAEMGDLVLSELARAGFRRYEVSGYAQEGRRCRHNLNYWGYGDYLAIGAGAHGKISDERGVFRYAQTGDPRRYMDNVRTLETPFQESRWVGRDELPFEFMLDGLRLTDGVTVQSFEERTGLGYSVIEPAVNEAVGEGLLTAESGRLVPTARGLDFLSDLQELFLP